MRWWFIVFGLLVVASAKPKDYNEDGETDSLSIEEQEDHCEEIQCSGKGYECIGGQCYCSFGYVPNPFQTRCVRCPGLGEKCFGPCCSNNATLSCWQGICQPCYDSMGTWICRDSLDHMLLVSSTQIAMATALVLGVIATFMLLYKLCASTSLRPLGSGRTNCEGRLSIGSLQLYVDQRLRDAPPRYSRNTIIPPETTVIPVPATVYVNAGFVHDRTVPPPPYTPKEEDAQIAQSPHVPATIHI